MKTLMIYSTTDGHTVKICERIKKIMEESAHSVTLISIDNISNVNIQSFEKIIIGASIRYGHHSKKVTEFINKNVKILEQKESAFFSVNIVARKPNKNTPETNPYLRKYLKRISWRPNQLAVFAGHLNYPMYSAFDRQMIRFIMWMTKGPTDPKTIIEFTDWKAVEDFAHSISR